MFDILLSTHNGAPFLREQLDSLLAQTVTDWTLWIRDDASTDDSTAILEEYQQRFPHKIHIIPIATPVILRPSREANLLRSSDAQSASEDDGRHLGAAQSFGLLLARSTAPYILFCDQDDRWLPNKIERSFNKMKALEAHFGAATPLLLHTDLCVTDAALKPLASSFAAHMHLRPEIVPLKRLLVQNVATGCTMLFNRALADLALPIPPAARLHDTWIALAAALFGHIEWLPTPTVLYRQHATNRIGLRRHTDLRAILNANIAQAHALLGAYGLRIPTHHRAVVERFLALAQTDRFCGIRLWQEGYRRLPWYQNLPFMALSKPVRDDSP